jgi:hypothetical protein
MERDDELLTPTVGTTRRSDDRPWRLGSQFWVAFFGGPAAAALVGHLNGSRLGIPERARWWIVAAGLGGLGLGVAIAVAIVSFDVDVGARLANQMAGVVTYGATYKLQRSGDRVYQFYGDDEDAYDSLWGPGVAIVLGAGIPSALLIAAVMAGVDA